MKTKLLALEALNRAIATCLDERAHHEFMCQPDHFIRQAMSALEADIAHPSAQVTDAGYFYNLVVHALMDVDAPHGGCKSRLKDIAEKLEVLMIASRGQA